MKLFDRTSRYSEHAMGNGPTKAATVPFESMQKWDPHLNFPKTGRLARPLENAKFLHAIKPDSSFKVLVIIK
jgi:hypothetical protein